MKDFSKKIISTATAIAVMAGMSVFAEGNAQPEAVTAVNAVTESTASNCSHTNATVTTSQSPINLSHHFYNGKACTIRSYTVTYTVTCSNCGAVIKTWSESIENHTSCGK